MVYLIFIEPFSTKSFFSLVDCVVMGKILFFRDFYNVCMTPDRLLAFGSLANHEGDALVV
jgi:hypothetical protein